MQCAKHSLVGFILFHGESRRVGCRADRLVALSLSDKGLG